MKALLRRRQPVGDKHGDRIDGVVDQERQVFGFGCREGFEHIVGGVHAPGWATDASAHTVIIFGA